MALEDAFGGGYGVPKEKGGGKEAGWLNTASKEGRKGN